MTKIHFGDPSLRTVRRVCRYELHGVAFVEEYDKTVWFSFEFHVGMLSLRMEDAYPAKEVYYFFKKLFDRYSSETEGLTKGLGLYTSWNMKEEMLKETVNEIEKVLGNKWKEVFKKMMERKLDSSGD